MRAGWIEVQHHPLRCKFGSYSHASPRTTHKAKELPAVPQILCGDTFASNPALTSITSFTRRQFTTTP